MSRALTPRVLRRRVRRALRRMSPLQRAIFLAMRFEEASYPELAPRHGIALAVVESEFAAALVILSRTLHEREPWWRRLWPF